MGKEATKTESERQFEAFLASSGFGDFKFELEVSGTAKKPDYSVWIKGERLLFDVKEFRSTESDYAAKGGAYDPYSPIRKKIEEARRKFRETKDYCCSLVLYNYDKPLIALDFSSVFSAMLGNFGVQIPINSESGLGSFEKSQTGFLGRGGKMIRYCERLPKEPQNTTISAIIVLEDFKVGLQKLQIEADRQIRSSDLRTIMKETLDLIEASRGTEQDVSQTALRVVTYENPFAAKPLPMGIFNGPYDERFGARKGYIQRISAGEGIVKLESEGGTNSSPFWAD